MAKKIPQVNSSAKKVKAEKSTAIVATVDSGAAVVKSPSKGFGNVVMVYSKSSSHACALLNPEISTIEGLKFLSGTQCTGKEGHRMEKKRTHIPLDHVASIVEFLTEEDLWSEPQPRHLRIAEELPASNIPLTSHEQGRGHDRQGHRPHRRDRHNRHEGRHEGRHDGRQGDRQGGKNRGDQRDGNRDARFQERHDFGRDRDFNR